MGVREIEDPAAFSAAAEPLLMADEARHNLALGLLRLLIDDPGAYPISPPS